MFLKNNKQYSLQGTCYLIVFSHICGNLWNGNRKWNHKNLKSHHKNKPVIISAQNTYTEN